GAWLLLFISRPSSPAAAFRPSPAFSSRTLLTTTEPSRPEFSAICRTGSSSERWMMRAPAASSGSSSLSGARPGAGAGDLVRLVELVRVEAGLGVQQRHAATRNDTLLEGGAGRLQRVLDAVL